jgi:glycosyltransferase involved in cell wall biosynthesis/GR25 family glycosyltransferase involved in LPS biosynthesis
MTARSFADAVPPAEINALGSSICLSMIVKNEAPVIRRCLESVRPLIDHWIIVDTGSTDGTQDIIREYMKDLPGELHERPWRDFAHNRTEALVLARPHADYTLIIDADDNLETPAAFERPALDADCYMLDIADTSISYQRKQLVKNTLPWRYAGVLHEFLTCEDEKSVGHFPVLMRRNHDGARRRDPSTYRRDVEVLERALQTETDPFLVARYTFYLGQSHRDCGEKEPALQAYLRRAELGYWQEEVFISLYQAAKLTEELGRDPDEVIQAYLRAADAAPGRAEALHGAARFCRIQGRNQQGCEIARRGLQIPLPADALFVEPWIYHYGLKDEFSVNAYWAGHYREALQACLDILESGACPADMRPRIAANARFSIDKLGGTPDLAEFEMKLRDRGYEASWTAAMPVTAPVTAPLVSVITPTHDRAAFLVTARKWFEAQDYPNLEWLILDDGDAPDPAFATTPSDIRYHHVQGRLTIGAKRNWLVEQARGEIIVHFDDDDYYAPNYVSRMVGELDRRQADLLNLRGWWLYDLRSSFLGYWDLTQKHGLHYRCDSDGVACMVLDPHNDAGFRDTHYGFGFSFAYRRSVWETAPFPDIDFDEDGGFSRTARERFVVDGFPDTEGLCLHYLHEKSSSRCYPQQSAPEFLLETLFPGLRATPAALPPIQLINLDRSIGRLAEFERRNRHLKHVTRYPAVEGGRVDRAALIATDVIAEDCPYSAGTLGCALSHIELWRLAAEEDRALTIFEDDVVAAFDFERRAAEHLARLPADWDIVFWGYCSDRLSAWIDIGVTQANMTFYAPRNFADVAEFQADQPGGALIRLLNCWGALAYSLSPNGARRLLSECLPLRRRAVKFARPGVSFWDEGIDAAMNGAIPQMNAYICVPPLVLHAPPDDSSSERKAIDTAPKAETAG